MRQITSFTPKTSRGELAGEVVAVIALGDGDEGIGLAGAGALQDLPVHTVADGRAATEGVGQPPELAGVEVEDGDLVTIAVEASGDGGAGAPAAHDDDVHRRAAAFPTAGVACSSRSRTIQTLQEACPRT